MDETIRMVTPPTVPTARSIIHPFVDVMLYLTYHREAIRQATQCGLNDAYDTYYAQHVDSLIGRQLQVLLFAHSLGSVICYDLFSHQHHLNFPVLALYCVGSPLGLFLATRCHIPGSLPSVYPIENTGSRHFYNIMYPCDPFAYRFEPFINMDLANLYPIVLPTCPSPPVSRIVSAITTAAGFFTTKWGNTAAAQNSAVSHPPTTFDAIVPAAEPPFSTKEYTPEHKITATQSCPTTTPPTVDAPVPTAVERFDFQLQMPYTNMSHYADIASAHSIYWLSEDVMYFMLSQTLQCTLLARGSFVGKPMKSAVDCHIRATTTQAADSS
jgi:hypothetical protein